MVKLYISVQCIVSWYHQSSAKLVQNFMKLTAKKASFKRSKMIHNVEWRNETSRLPLDNLTDNSSKNRQFENFQALLCRSVRFKRFML